MWKTCSSLPRERGSPNSEWSFMVQELVHRVEKSSVVYMQDGLQKSNSRLFLLRIVIVLLKFQSWKQSLLKLFKRTDWDDEGRSLFFIIFDVVISVVHISKHLDSRRTHWITQILKGRLVCSWIVDNLLKRKLLNRFRYYLTTFKLVLTPFFFLAWAWALVTKWFIDFIILF